MAFNAQQPIMINQAPPPPPNEFDNMLIGMGLLISVCFSPVIAACGLICADFQDVVFRGSYSRGVGAGFIVWGIIFSILSSIYRNLICVPSCVTTLTENPSIFASTTDQIAKLCDSSCGLYTYVWIPLAVASFIIGSIMLNNSKKILNSRNRVRPQQTTTAVVMQGGNGGYGQAVYPQQQQYSPYPQQQQYPQVPSPPPQYTRRLSLESLALEIHVPKLLDVKGGMDEVMGSDFLQLQERYGITSEEYTRLKAYKKLTHLHLPIMYGQQQTITINSNPIQPAVRRNFDLGYVTIGLLASVCFSPILAAFALACTDHANIIFRASYSRGVGMGFIFYSIAMLGLNWVLRTEVCIPLCVAGINSTSTDTTSDSYYDSFYSAATYSYNVSYCESSCSLCYLLIPVGIIWSLIGWVMFHNSNIILNGRINPIQTTVVYNPGIAGPQPGFAPYQQQSFQQQQPPMYGGGQFSAPNQYQQQFSPMATNSYGTPNPYGARRLSLGKPCIGVKHPQTRWT
ncbi:hypothetical protein BDR26DRAFT_933791 [Obelidium mucronatum]|nr:hypothetical protein BDR26DRAFT_933791 [Obelidium mucronatum]